MYLEDRAESYRIKTSFIIQIVYTAFVVFIQFLDYMVCVSCSTTMHGVFSCLWIGCSNVAKRLNRSAFRCRTSFRVGNVNADPSLVGAANCYFGAWAAASLGDCATGSLNQKTRRYSSCAWAFRAKTPCRRRRPSDWGYGATSTSLTTPVYQQ